MKTTIVLALFGATLALAACGGGAPGKSEVQDAMNRYAAENKLLFGDDKPVVKDAKCTKTGNDTYSCITSLATSSDPEAHTVTVQLTKLNGKWQAQITQLSPF